MEGERVLVWLRMDCIDAYQASAGPIELPPYLHVDCVLESALHPRPKLPNSSRWGRMGAFSFLFS